ncbi:metallophosphoesterase [Halobacterium litoreum]|uniref:Metallophosphoesterase n=1 Tax=Halobacterium litoreum TaxID=2039234 RepID=A0ABD5NHS7_9EURY|nr:metallophosphoesterase [Halobacterium litoreum]UHH12501.1 metallophosphoesterase [Halobacterium litoreum]
MSDTPSWAEFGERAAYLPDADALVLADVHAGRDAASDVSLPLGERADVVERVDALLEEFAPGTVVVAGDLLHVHGSVPEGTTETVEALAAAAERAGATYRVVRGNHDTMLDAVGVDAETYVELADGTVVCHGHEEPPVEASRYVVGHQHPAVEIEGQRHPCFLYGPNQCGGGDALVLPAFTRLAPGTLVNRLTEGAAVSPLLSDPTGYRPIVVSGGEALGFPALGDLRGLL